MNARNGMGDTALHRAAFTGRTVSLTFIFEKSEACRLILESSISKYHRDVKNYVISACFLHHDQDVVTVLIQHNADVMIINGEGRKPSQVTNNAEVKQLIKG